MRIQMHVKRVPYFGHQSEADRHILASRLKPTAYPQRVLDNGMHCCAAIGVDRQREEIHVVSAVTLLMLR
jgi:hypothetical protein